MAKPFWSRKRKCTNEEFVRIWQQAVDTADAVAKTGYTRQGARSRACALRKLGVKLKRMSHPRVDVEALNKIIKELKEGC